MLNDYGIQHFHLGTTPDPKHSNLIQGTNELLFAVVKNDDFYALGIFDHKAWSKQALLDIVQANWPKLMEPYVLKGALGLSFNATGEEAAKLRKAGINVITQGADRSIRMGMGGGVASDRTSLSVNRDVIQIERHVKGLQKDVISTLTREGTSSAAEVRIEWRRDVPFAVTLPPSLEIDLGDRLRIPSL